VPARVHPITTAFTGSGYSTSADQAGNKTLTEIFFGGKKYELTIGGASAATAAAADKTQGTN
jgi:hypothetical protein